MDIIIGAETIYMPLRGVGKCPQNIMDLLDKEIPQILGDLIGALDLYDIYSTRKPNWFRKTHDPLNISNFRFTEIHKNEKLKAALNAKANDENIIRLVNQIESYPTMLRF